MDRGYESDLIGAHSRRLGHVRSSTPRPREHSVPMAPHQALRFRERTTWSGLLALEAELRRRNGPSPRMGQGHGALMFGILALTADQILRLSPPS